MKEGKERRKEGNTGGRDSLSRKLLSGCPPLRNQISSRRFRHPRPGLQHHLPETVIIIIIVIINHQSSIKKEKGMDRLTSSEHGRSDSHPPGSEIK